ncbi:MAG: hypothetical protein EP344_17305 [Bacteroidetes bacterium]|nr:MAG: hypothetical protein EP344_17305 [Bacteroidota bacterium]
MKTRTALLFTCLATLLASVPALAQTDSITPQPYDNIFARLQQYDPLYVIIEADLRALKKAREDEAWQHATFMIMDGDSVAYSQPIQVAARGKMRKKTCDIPPIKIRFFEEKPDNDSIADINELKLVVNCRNTEEDEQLVLRENFAYQLYNMLTEESFRVKSVYLTIKEPGRKRNSLETKAFFIESQQELAARLGARALKSRIFSPKRIDSLAYTRMSLFQFMIGNTDWGSYTRHNVKVIAYPSGRMVVVPYDFDYSGLVSADYAIPSPDSKIENVRERYYLGLCHSDSLYQQAFREFISKKEQILAACKEYPGFTYTTQEDTYVYLNEFFRILDDPEKTRKEILEHCGIRLKKD